MEVLNHHIYEYSKGLRNLVLHTMNMQEVELAIKKLKRRNIRYCIQQVSFNKCNIFFGKPECVRIIEPMIHRSLTNLTAEEDFMLGIMLGYDRMLQCERYIARKQLFQLTAT
ncbi:MAG: DUF2023 family protein [Mangrovibacterium sp.]